MVKPDTAPSSKDPVSKKKSLPKPTFKDTGQSLQERLHTLLTRLSDAGKILSTWPETQTGDDSISIHTKTTTKLIQAIQRTVDGIKLVEEKVNAGAYTGDDSKPSPEDIALTNQLRQTPVPIDVLDMMDYAHNVNPDCFARGLIKESMRQLGNLQRRKASMRLLAKAIDNGMKNKERQLELLKTLKNIDAQLEATTPSISNPLPDGTSVSVTTDVKSTIADKSNAQSDESAGADLSTSEANTKRKRKRDGEELDGDDSRPIKR
uniref:Mediator of RNA polymerase II transcription subunit 10 n=1 Tax=Chaetoceros debilis TaxID=122233 RepID=A0A7S3QJR3_9STRA|mmetsp:Transcript_4921/g.7226  ORF Transcript_4921/g.7226 Transcript_4921/m.7226 type:complete len:263 (-) Transcript_4921:158-946(-)|eukprot:CAMPEP_0194086724 /NCGR_PEP_ID=MMETSP0149-20130528/22203_1 /TAXON_ID=122233 /ORGANISM="Chaetoceros debilis, Strain MM31A-1" /LENGTH=262 /DNA_ID=CAMNT_0038769877 /DNA_START=168 /DNA_END=956 /DNA_ORIENTATION=+